MNTSDNSQKKPEIRTNTDREIRQEAPSGPPDSRKGPKALRLSLFTALALVFLLSLAGCRSGNDPSSGLPDERDECGECLDMPTGEVCTAEGETIRNSCLAICRGKKIQCFQSCPCPKPDDKKDK